MNISKEQIDALNAVVTVNIEKADYSERVDNVLKDYRKNANIPGFRKGHVPMGMVKKQYGTAVKVDEINKILQESLNNFITEEKLDILGNPLPQENETLDWNAEDFKFDFELGLAPEFEVKLQGKKAIDSYKIVATDEMIDEQIASFQKQYGTLSPIETAVEGALVAGIFENEDADISKQTTLELDNLEEGAQKLFIGAKVNDVITLNTKEIFKNSQLLVSQVGVSQELKDTIDVDVNFTISEINERILAELDQELFDKVYGEGTVKSVTELKEKIKSETENQFAHQADQFLLNKVTESVIENTEFDLPADFLKKWLRTAGEKELTAEEAATEYEKSEKGLRFQLIEGKIIKDNDLQIQFEELKDFAKKMIANQYAQYGMPAPSEEDLEGTAARIFQNQDEVKRLSEQLMSTKVLDFYKENVKTKVKEVSFEEFIAEAYKTDEK